MQTEEKPQPPEPRPLPRYAELVRERLVTAQEAAEMLREECLVRWPQKKEP